MKSGSLSIIRRLARILNKERFKLIYQFVLRFIAFSIPAIIFAFLILEIFARFFLHASDAPDIYFDTNLGNIFFPNQKGIYVKKDNPPIMAEYRINNVGWNSPHDYRENKASDVYRIAVVGDSFIEALQINYNKSYPYLLERILNEKKWNNKKVEVYTFGHSGANLNHYFHIAELVDQKYNPDLIIVNIVTNDFKESLYEYNRKDNWSLQLVNGNFIEEPPHKVSNLFIKRVVRKSALVRYLTVNLDLINTSLLLNKLFYADTRQDGKPNTNLEKLFSMDEFLQKIVENVLTRFSELSNKNSFELLLVLDTDRKTIYNGEDIKTTESYRVNKSVENVAKKLRIDTINLSSTFQEDWKEKKEKFNWAIDEHWNEYGHQVIVDALYKQLTTSRLRLSR